MSWRDTSTPLPKSHRRVPPPETPKAMSLTITPTPSSPDVRAPLLAEFEALRARAAAGDPQAQRDLGCAYIWGDDACWGEGVVPRDLALARHWYVLAAEQGHAEAMSDVSYMLLEGHGGSPDVERGLRYLRFLATRRYCVIGGEDAAQLLACYHDSGAFGLPQDPAEVQKWLRLARDHRRFYRGHLRKHRTSWRIFRLYADGRRARVE